MSAAEALALAPSHPDVRIAMVVDPALPPGLLANTVAVIGVGIGAADSTLGAVPLTDRQGRTIASSANQPIPVLQAEAQALVAVLARALPAPAGATVVAFPRFGRSLHVFDDFRRQFPGRDLLAEPIEGIGLAGPARWVRSLTGSLRLLR